MRRSNWLPATPVEWIVMLVLVGMISFILLILLSALIDPQQPLAG